MRNLFAKLFCRLYPFYRCVKQHALYRMIKKDKNIIIKNTVYLNADVKIDTRFGGKIIIDDHTRINEGVLILTYGGYIKIGKNCDINPYTIIYGHGKGTQIGNNVLIAGHCMVVPANHNFSDRSKNIIQQGISSKGIIIEDDVWIAHGCTITDGVIIGKGAVISAGSVVIDSVPSYSIYGGVPAKFIKDR